MTSYSPEFDWNPSKDDDHSIVVRHQPAIAVYLNPHDEVVVRQQDQYDESDDHFVYVTRDNVLRLAQRMLEVAGIEVVAAAEPLLLAPPKDVTAAERMRRYRHRKHNGDRNDDRDSVAEEPELRLVAAE
jgi:hypothetical protein